MNLSVIKGLVALIQANGGSIDSRIRLQKQAYLLKWLGYPNFATLRFSYHHFGPYSRDLSEDIHNAVLDGLVKETFEEFDNDITRYSYRVTSQGSSTCPETLDDSLHELVDAMRAYHWRVLELGATALFLERDEKLAPEAAFRRALQLKPSCASYEEEAQELVATLRHSRVSRPASSLS